MRAVFVGGCERSGTTFLGSLLGAHSHCIATPESHFKIEPLLSEIEKRGGRPDADILRAVKEDVQLRLWNLAEPEIRGLDEAVSADEAMYAIVRAYGRKVRRTDVSVWIDHTPSNVKYITRLGRHFPGARFIHVIRDGRAVAASLMRVKFGPNTIKACADHWMGRIAAGLAAEATLPAGVMMRVHYEDLVHETELTVRKICGFVGLEFEESMLSASGFRPEAFGGKVNRLVGGPPVPDRAAAWESALDRRQIEIFEAWTGDLLPCLGYELKCAPARGPSWPEKLRMDLKEVAGRIVHATTYRWSQRRHATRGPAR
ncbi:MAG TPA: sulfotransferase [Gemmatimonadota bacterium]|nr:sulfotransferase [Gemmatimonadota bacterium]